MTALEVQIRQELIVWAWKRFGVRVDTDSEFTDLAHRLALLGQHGKKGG